MKRMIPLLPLIMFCFMGADVPERSRDTRHMKDNNAIDPSGARASACTAVDPRLYDMKGFVRNRLTAATEKEKMESAGLAAEGENL